MPENYLWNGPINPSPTYGDDGYTDREPEPIEIGGWTARMFEARDGRGIWRTYWTITAPGGNSVLEVPDVERWGDLEALAHFILAATTEARRVEDE